ncbi:MAG: sigma-E factor negative regulatory protein [Gammaproteobacteria bacterium]|nr:sigma-E factor negative regulatory protein [Gammaproteobacteria bacterium]MCP5136880.1 sigma-E factor negative regulatory protein [Gammaproteobacteria bacterium]
MNEQIREQLSALMDGELPTAERDLLLRRISAEPALRDWWRRQHRAREVMRNEVSPMMEVDLSVRVMDALADDSAMRVPQIAAKAAGPAWWRPVAGLAVAASVATVAVLGVQGLQRESDAPTLIAERVPAENLGTPIWASRSARNADITTVSTGDDMRRVRDARLDAYLASHAEQAMMLGSSPWMPYSQADR